MIRKPFPTTPDDRDQKRFAAIEARLRTAERKTTVKTVTGWTSGSPSAPPGTIVYDTGTSRLWVSDGSGWHYVVTT